MGKTAKNVEDRHIATTEDQQDVAYSLSMDTNFDDLD